MTVPFKDSPRLSLRDHMADNLDSLKQAAATLERVATPVITVICLGSLVFESTTGWVTAVSALPALGGCAYRLYKHRNSD